MWLEQYHRHRFWWIGAFRLQAVAVPARLFLGVPLTSGLVLSLAGLLLVVFGCLRISRASAPGRLIAVLALAPLLEAEPPGLEACASRPNDRNRPLRRDAAAGGVAAIRGGRRW